MVPVRKFTMVYQMNRDNHATLWIIYHQYYYQIKNKLLIIDRSSLSTLWILGDSILQYSTGPAGGANRIPRGNQPLGREREDRSQKTLRSCRKILTSSLIMINLITLVNSKSGFILINTAWRIAFCWCW